MLLLTPLLLILLLLPLPRALTAEILLLEEETFGKTLMVPEGAGGAEPKPGGRGVEGVFGVEGTFAACSGSSPLPINKFSKSSTSLLGSCFRGRCLDAFDGVVSVVDVVIVLDVIEFGANE